ncbi:Histidine kinase-, DNA gyrase B-, and HSP90-like ATPase [Micromonospora pattaloongensis]|uniref:histidine kinase n=1 Tax=Micromonospora pattaloongensis TaxID=405436 RepID=A0A1H3SPX7_9ACTN|nr:ATP-binding protein [Micromonospora pattaloongensis]SDZ39984.1 Histidine kinase-, DNA gyrase B-, and HSP90-like ATPase [Micromonospora pattaloongensis]
MSGTSGWRRSLARWLDPTVDVLPEPAPPAPASPQPAPDPWPAISEQFALRIMAAAYQMGGQLEAAEADERDPDRLEKLYRIDHANTRVRRQAENLQVLTGRKVEDAGAQVTALLDVVRASSSAIEYYQRVQLGRIAELAVVAFAADDVIRVITELLDNATRFSPPTARVIVSAHLTERGSILLRIEDTGVGIRPDQLRELNTMLAADSPAPLRAEPALQLGLAVVQRLALAHRMRVQLTSREPGGTTATVLIPEWLLCEIPQVPTAGRPAPPAMPVSGPPPAQRPPFVVYQGGAEPAVPAPRHAERRSGGAHAAGAPVARPTGAATHAAPSPHSAPPVAPHSAPATANGVPVVGSDTAALPAVAPRATATGLPVRVPASLRGDDPAPPAPTPSFGEPSGDRERWADETADFAAGISDALRTATDPSSEGNPR